MYCDSRALIALSLSVLLTGQCAFADGLLPPKQSPVVKAETVAPEVKQEPIKAEVTSTQPYVTITNKTIPLNSRLKKQYTGYSISVTNESPTQIELLHGDVVNGVNGQGAALGVQKSSAAAIGTLIGGGLVLGIVTFGITFLAGLLASPFVYAVNHRANNKAAAEGVGYSNQVNTGVLNTGDSLVFTTLVPISQKPQLKLTFRNLTNNEIFSVTR